MVRPIIPNIRTQLIKAVNKDGLMAASYHLDRLRSVIDREKCLKEHGGAHLRRGSLIRSITAKRYYELRRAWDMLTS